MQLRIQVQHNFSFSDKKIKLFVELVIGNCDSGEWAASTERRLRMEDRGWMRLLLSSLVLLHSLSSSCYLSLSLSTH
jgi:hypothetical protein